jgi:UDP-4-amino-4,6-dideoxy-N-acetyl-beta-L-altrosamine transaminase
LQEFIPYSKQSISEDDIEQVVKALKSDFLTQGPLQRSFEVDIENYVGAKHAQVVSSATAALHLACLALGVCQGDIVWTSPITFVASANCVLYCGATVEFIDVDPISYNLCIETLAENLKRAKKNGRLPKVVIPVHLCGQSCDMERLWDLSLIYGFAIIEDASHAFGASYKGKKVGSCSYSHLAVFSMHAVKMITSGEGGVVVTNDASIIDATRMLGSHGITKSRDKFTGDAAATEGGWYYEQQRLGFNYRMTDFQCALGISQLKRLDKFVAKRNKLAQRYDDRLKSLPVKVPIQSDFCVSSRHLYVIRLDLDNLTISRNDLYREMLSLNIGVNLHYMPVYKQPYYIENKIGGEYACPEAEAYHQEALTIPLHQEMTDIQQEYIIKCLSEMLTFGRADSAGEK